MELLAMTINFDDYKYYPALRTRPAEMHGYQMLAESIKDGLLPLFTAGAWPRQPGIDVAMRNALTAAGERPFILDLTSEKAYETEDIHGLKDPKDNFSNWINFCSSYDSCIPVVQMSPGVKTSQVIKQVIALEKRKIGKVAFRVNDFNNDPEKIIAALSALDSAENGIVIIDAGYIRETMAASIAACVLAINEIREEVEDAIISVISTSFPSSFTPFLDASSQGKRGIINIMERTLHQEIGSDAAIFGDHGSIHAKVYPTSGGRYTPRIDYPHYDAWVFERRPETNSEGYIDAAKELIKNYSEVSDDETWGAQMIKNAASGEIDGMKTPSAWIAARVNMHISRQFELSSSSIETDEEDDDFF